MISLKRPRQQRRLGVGGAADGLALIPGADDVGAHRGGSDEQDADGPLWCRTSARSAGPRSPAGPCACCNSTTRNVGPLTTREIVAVCDFDRDAILHYIKVSEEQRFSWCISAYDAVEREDEELAAACQHEEKARMGTVKSLRVAMRLVVLSGRLDEVTSNANNRSLVSERNSLPRRAFPSSLARSNVPRAARNGRLSQSITGPGNQAVLFARQFVRHSMLGAERCKKQQMISSYRLNREPSSIWACRCTRSCLLLLLNS